MVIKLGDVGVDTGNKKKKWAKKKGKRSLAEGGLTSDKKIESENVEAKKSKPDVDEAVLTFLANCDQVLELESALPVKLCSLLDLLESILDKNVNTVLLKPDFAAWIKNVLLNILKDVQKAKVPKGLFKCLNLAVKVVPTVFESILENVLVVCYFHPETVAGVDDSFDIFMCELVHTFEKLRRFPKFIAKLLCCVRDNLKPDSQLSRTIMSPSFASVVGPVINSLTVGQVTDLWKTLQHNLEVECVKSFASGEEDFKTKTLFFIVSNIFAEFLSNIKVADYTIPSSTVEKISEMIIKLRDDCLKPLGISLSSRKKVGADIMKPFLKLAHAYGQLHCVLLSYNSKYKDCKHTINLKTLQNAMDLSYLHPYLSSECWITLFNRTLKSEDPEMTQLLVDLVVQKLTFMTALDQRKCENITTTSADEQNQKEEGACEESKNHQEQLSQSAQFVWNHQNKTSIQLSDETLFIISQYIEPRKLIELAGSLVEQLHENGTLDKISDSKCDTLSISKEHSLLITENSTFHYALILESLAEILRRVQKMKLQPKAIKNILHDVLSIESRTALIKGSSFTKMSVKSGQVKCLVTENLLFSVNELLGSINLKTTSSNKGEEFSSKLINPMLQFLSSLDFETYPKDVKTIVFLCSVVILIALVEQQSDNTVFAPVAKIVATAGSLSQGNETLFSIHWMHLFQWFRSKVDCFEPNVQKDLCNMILSNVYVSSKVVGEFEQEIHTMSDFVDFNSSLAHVALISLEFLLKELQGTKTKLTLQLQDHSRKLVHFIVKKLNGTDSATSSNFYRACWVSQLAIDVMSESTLTSYKQLIGSNIKAAIKFLKTSISSDNLPEDRLPVSHCVKFLYAIIKSRTKLEDSLPKDFLGKVWKSCMHPIIMSHDDRLKSLIPIHFVKHVLEAANISELQIICESIEQKLSKLGTDPAAKNQEISMLIKVISDFVDAELGPECKTIRRHTIQEFLHKVLPLSLEWNIKDPKCLNGVIIPYIQFQTKLLRRRGAIVNLKTLAVCLTSITSVQMNAVDIDDISTFRTLFCTLAELLNAFAVHRLDVVQFRSHIFLQCFQYLIEVLTKRADQKNKLADDEIISLRTCAYSIERLCQSMKLGQKEFSRVSPYFIAALIRQFELLTIYPAVKVPLLGGCNKLLDLCDDHGVALLNSLLTVGSKEIFKAIYDQFKKYYQYKGRV